LAESAVWFSLTDEVLSRREHSRARLGRTQYPTVSGPPHLLGPWGSAGSGVVRVASLSPLPAGHQLSGLV